MESERQVTFDEGKSLADTFGIKFFETSAKGDINVNEAFQTICKEIKEKINTAPEAEHDFISLTSGKAGSKNGKEGKTCCQ